MGSTQSIGFCIPGEQDMKWTGIYFLGYMILLSGAIAALWKLGVIAKFGAGWTAIGIIIAIGLGIMLSVSSGSDKKTIEIEK